MWVDLPYLKWVVKHWGVKGLHGPWLFWHASRSLIYLVFSGQSILIVWVPPPPLFQNGHTLKLRSKGFLIERCGKAGKRAARQWITYNLALQGSGSSPAWSSWGIWASSIFFQSHNLPTDSLKWFQLLAAWVKIAWLCLEVRARIRGMLEEKLRQLVY